MRRPTPLPVAASVIALAVAGTASAHSGLESTSPRKGATIATLPGSVTLTFEGQIGRVVSVRVTRRGSTTNYVTKVGRDPRNVARVKATLRRVGPAGLYTVAWKVRSADGHLESGAFGFRTRRAG